MNPTEDTISTNDSFSLFTKESDVYALGMTILEVHTFVIVFDVELLINTTCVDLHRQNSFQPKEER